MLMTGCAGHRERERERVLIEVFHLPYMLEPQFARRLGAAEIGCHQNNRF